MTGWGKKGGLGYSYSCILYCEGGEPLEQDAQRNYGYPIPGSVQGQVQWSSEQPDLVEGVPAHGKGLEVDDL